MLWASLTSSSVASSERPVNFALFTLNDRVTLHATPTDIVLYDCAPVVASGIASLLQRLNERDLVAPSKDYYVQGEVVVIAYDYQDQYQVHWGCVVSDGVDDNDNVLVQTGRTQTTSIPWRHLSIVRISRRDKVYVRSRALAKYGLDKKKFTGRALKFIEYVHNYRDECWNRNNIPDDLFTLRVRTGFKTSIDVLQKDIVRVGNIKSFLRTAENDRNGLHSYQWNRDDDSSRRLKSKSKLFYYNVADYLVSSGDETDTDDDEEKKSQPRQKIARQRNRIKSMSYDNKEDIQWQWENLELTDELVQKLESQWKALPAVFGPDRRQLVKNPSVSFPNIGRIKVQWECCFKTVGATDNEIERPVYIRMVFTGTGCVVSDDGYSSHLPSRLITFGCQRFTVLVRVHSE